MVKLQKNSGKRLNLSFIVPPPQQLWPEQSEGSGRIPQGGHSTQWAYETKQKASSFPLTPLSPTSSLCHLHRLHHCSLSPNPYPPKLEKKVTIIHTILCIYLDVNSNGGSSLLLMPIHTPLLPRNYRMQWGSFSSSECWLSHSFSIPLNLSSSLSFQSCLCALPYLPSTDINKGAFANCISIWFSTSLIFPPKATPIYKGKRHLVESKLKGHLLVIFPK